MSYFYTKVLGKFLQPRATPISLPFFYSTISNTVCCVFSDWHDRHYLRVAALILSTQDSLWGRVKSPGSVQFSSVTQSVWLFATPWIAAHQASLSITNTRSSLRLTSIESVMPSSHLILCRPLLLLPWIPPSIRVFSNESTLHMRWPKY